MNDLVKFKREIEFICKLRFRAEWRAMYYAHDWEVYFHEGYRVNNAHEAVDYARSQM